jgi:hypothetical protein
MKDFDPTGFTAFWIYVTVKKIYFKPGGKYDILRQRLPRKQQFLKAWNDGRKDRDGMLFYKFMENMPRKKIEYIRAFATYFLWSEDFHIRQIIHDNFRRYKANVLELNDIEATVKSDYLSAILHCYEKDVTPETMFYGDKSLPLIFKLYDRGLISHNSLIAFDEVFRVRSKLNNYNVDVILQERIKKYELIFDKYRPLVYNHFDSIEWKKTLQKYHKKIMKEGPTA